MTARSFTAAEFEALPEWDTWENYTDPETGITTRERKMRLFRGEGPAESGRRHTYGTTCAGCGRQAVNLQATSKYWDGSSVNYTA